jgi:ATP-binding cassette, subfamily F, member 3
MKIAYYQQHQADCLPYDLTPLQHLTNIAATLVSGEAADATGGSNRFNEQVLRAHLGAFGLGGELALQQIGVLSGGQKSRVVFAELTLQKSVHSSSLCLSPLAC